MTSLPRWDSVRQSHQPAISDERLDYIEDRIDAIDAETDDLTTVPTATAVGSTDRVVIVKEGGATDSVQQLPATKLSIMDVQEFTNASSTTGQWVKPSAGTRVRVTLIGGGGGAGSGRKGAAGSVRCGGGGGAGGGLQVFDLPLSAFAAQETVTFSSLVAAGGAAVSASDTNGNNGTAGANINFTCGSLTLGVFGGAAGSGGTNAAGTGGSNVVANGGAGGSASASGGNGASGTGSGLIPMYGQGGGGGGGVSAANAAGTGGAGGNCIPFGDYTGAAAGVAGANRASVGMQGGGGGGGGGSTSGNATDGGAGGNYGGGGGGGGAAVNAVGNSGKGGDGGLAYVRFEVY